ncbi:hypothetical protein SAMN04490357_2682 [Streptomyces misionensis]|uniref:Uncharacterized protein n=1 Tax=Streptomyces misionensis TaxID=67331 RepID=A0A1H4UPX5_9ACTN|nr:hypothetical protein [Streptomyces misionensis]SEC70458.1 hypothetical protein SAMN04490357_2682 [Streptomyces misionensis]
MPEWSFTLLVNQPLTAEQADVFDHCDAFADGSVSYTLGPENPGDFARVPDASALRELSCDIDAPTLLDAVAQVARDLRLVPGLRAVGVRYDDIVTLEEATQRSGRELSRRPEESAGFPAPEPGVGGTEFYSWRKIAAWLARIGDDVPETPPDLRVADLALRLADALEGVDVPPGVLRALGLPAT